MARPKDLLTLARIADETGISYATLRSYALKHAGEIPSEGEGRNTRYPRTAIKVFQRLRRESKPGRKPASASAALNVPVPVPAPAVKPAIQEAPPQALRPAGTDTSRLEQELAAIGGYLQRIANSLEKLSSEPRTAAPAPVAAVVPAPGPAPEERSEASAPAAPENVSAPRPVPLPVREVKDSQEPGGHRRLHSLPKVMGQRGKRPD